MKNKEVRYLLVVYSEKHDWYSATWLGCIVESSLKKIEEDRSSIECITLCKPIVKELKGSGYYKGEEGDRINVSETEVKDVTNVWNKIINLLAKLEPRSPIWKSIMDVKKKFEAGKYPTKTEFKKMNKLWTKYA